MVAMAATVRQLLDGTDSAGSCGRVGPGGSLSVGGRLGDRQGCLLRRCRAEGLGTGVGDMRMILMMGMIASRIMMMRSLMSMRIGGLGFLVGVGLGGEICLADGGRGGSSWEEPSCDVRRSRLSLCTLSRPLLGTLSLFGG